MPNQTKCQTKLNAKCQHSSTHLKHMQYPPNQHNWATDSVCCTVKECGRSRVQHTARVATVTSQVGTAVHPAALTKLMTKISKCTKPNKMLNASISKHMQYPPNWATDSVCCTVKECDRSRVQH